MDKFQKAKELYLEGYSICRAGQATGIPSTTLQRHLKKQGLVRKYTKRTKNFEDLSKRKFGKLSPSKSIIEKEGRVLWLCDCECGNQQKIRHTWLINGKAKMCGNCKATGSNSFAWKGVGQLSGTHWKNIKNGAKRNSRLLSFNISQEYAWDLYQKQNGQCALSGIKIPFPSKVEDRNNPSMDRIDSSQGYIEGNVQWVHKDVNRMKWDLSENRFVELCGLIFQHKEGG